MYTGFQLSQDLDKRVRQSAAAAYLSPARKNYFLRMAIVKVIEENYVQLARQKSVDEINGLIKTYQPFPVLNNKVLIKPLHILAISNNVPQSRYEITFDRPHNLDFVNNNSFELVFSNIQGVSISGLQTVTQGANDSTVYLSATPSGIHVANTGEATGEEWISDYYHLLAVESRHEHKLSTKIKSVTNNLYTDIVLGFDNNIRKGEKLRFQMVGAGGNWGDKYVNKLTPNKIRLYNDSELKIPFQVSGTFVPLGSIYRPLKRYCEPLLSDSKISHYGATPYFPLYQLSQNELKCYQSKDENDPNINQLQYVADYITTQAEIDITDNSKDLLQVYNMNMCNSIIEKAAELFFAVNTGSEDIQIVEAIK
jgi:hypothetical protein